MNNKGEFLTTAQIDQKFDFKCDFLQYNALKDAIPNQWRTMAKTMQIPPEAISFQEDLNVMVGKTAKPINLIKNNQIYWILVNDKRIESIIINKLPTDFGLNEEMCEMVFTIPRVITNTKIRAFQYKLLYNLTPTNLYLKRIKRNDTNLCNWCTEIDDTAHYFAKCTQLTPFWNSFATWCQGWLEEETNFTVEEVLLGILKKSNVQDTLNACILIAKWHIYKNKLNQTDTFFYRYLCELKYYINIEESIALKNNKLLEYKIKWQTVEEYLT
jgi:hypothetical protein